MRQCYESEQKKMVIKYLTDKYLAKRAALLIDEYYRTLDHPPDNYEIDVTAIAHYLGFKIQFAPLQETFGSDALGMILPTKKIIFIDHSLEPHGDNKGNRERILRFTIAHEIAHYVLHREWADDPISWWELSSADLNRIEYQADRFAAYLLMPDEHMKCVCFNGACATYDDNHQNMVICVANQFNVSKQSASIRIGGMGL